MKIIEKPTDIEIEGAKFHTASRPKNLNPILNSVNLSLIVGLPASGKSSLIKNLLLNPKLYNNVFNSVYYIFKPSHFSSLFKKITFSNCCSIKPCCSFINFSCFFNCSFCFSIDLLTTSYNSSSYQFTEPDQ